MPERYPNATRFRVVIDNSTGMTFRSDALGAYADDSLACVEARQRTGGLIQVAFPVSSTYGCRATTPRRTWTIDLSRVVPGSGAAPLGAVAPVATNIIVIPSLDPRGYVGLTDVPIGRSTGVQVFALVNRDNGDRLVFAPHGVRGCGPWIPGPFPQTTEARVLRASASRWEITLPEGSIGELYQFNPPSTPVLKGLYYFQAHVTITVIDSDGR
jgi:hypothetical protein